MLHSQVDDLKAKLAVQEIELKQKNDAADALIEIVGVETEKVSKEKTLGELLNYYNVDGYKYREICLQFFGDFNDCKPPRDMESPFDCMQLL